MARDRLVGHHRRHRARDLLNPHCCVRAPDTQIGGLVRDNYRRPWVVSNSSGTPPVLGMD